jgi:hypothetical protein
LPLSEKARIQVYLPDVSRQEYHDLLTALQQEFAYVFGGGTTVRGLEGSYLSRLGLIVRDRINPLYSDTPFAFEEHPDAVSRYADELHEAAFQALGDSAGWAAAIMAARDSAKAGTAKPTQISAPVPRPRGSRPRSSPGRQRCP